MWLSVLHLIQDSVVLRSYNSHNDYMMQMSAFNSLHDEFYNKQIYDMLDELQVSVCVDPIHCMCMTLFGMPRLFNLLVFSIEPTML